MIIEKENLLKYVTVNFDGEYNHELWGCLEDGICRCFKIKKLNDVSLSIRNLSVYFYNKYKNSDCYLRSNKIMRIVSDIDSDKLEMVDVWGIQIILIRNEIWKIDNWDIEIGDMYYGDEIVSVYLKDGFINQLNQDIKTMIFMKTLRSKTNFLFESTTKYIGQFQIESVKISDIDLISSNTHNFIDYTPQILVCEKVVNGWRLIEETINIPEKNNLEKIYIIGIS
jgi:hypothetical protein